MTNRENVFAQSLTWQEDIGKEIHVHQICRKQPAIVARPCLRLLRKDIGTVLERWGMPGSSALALSHHPLVLRQLLLGRVPSLWLEHNPCGFRDKSRLRHLWDGLNVVFVRFLSRINDSEVEERYRKACDRWKNPNFMFEFLVSSAPEGTRVPHFGEVPWAARSRGGLKPRVQPCFEAPAHDSAAIPYGTVVEPRRTRQSDGRTWAELTDGGWVPTAQSPLPVKGTAASVRMLDGGVRRTEHWGRQSHADGAWIDQRIKITVAKGVDSALHLWRWSHDWRAVLVPDGGGIVWVADDVANVAIRQILHLPQLEPPSSSSEPCPRRCSAEYAIAMWGSCRVPALVGRQVTILGPCNPEGKRLVCPAYRFFAALSHAARQGARIPLVPTSRWLRRLQGEDNRSVWVIVEDRSLLRMVPPAPGDPNSLLPALHHLLYQVLRQQPFDPPWRPRAELRFLFKVMSGTGAEGRGRPVRKQVKISRKGEYSSGHGQSLFLQLKGDSEASSEWGKCKGKSIVFDWELQHRPRGMTLPIIERVEFGDGWQLPGEEARPGPGVEVVVRCRGGHDWCWHAGRSSTCPRHWESSVDPIPDLSGLIRTSSGLPDLCRTKSDFRDLPY
eukprot:gene12381-biopygen6048